MDGCGCVQGRGWVRDCVVNAWVWMCAGGGGWVVDCVVNGWVWMCAGEGGGCVIVW